MSDAHVLGLLVMLEIVRRGALIVTLITGEPDGVVHARLVSSQVLGSVRFIVTLVTFVHYTLMDLVKGIYIIRVCPTY